jgi:hypothetical protein
MKTNGTSDAAPVDVFGSFDLEVVAAEVSRLHSEIADVASAQPTLSERLATLGEELQRDIQVFRDHGLAMDFTLPPPVAQRQFRQSIRGAFGLLGAEAFLSLEQERIRRQVAGTEGVVRLSRDERTTKLAELRGRLRRTLAHAEIVYRGTEGDREIVPRAPQCVSGEMFLASDSQLREWERG